MIDVCNHQFCRQSYQHIRIEYCVGLLPDALEIHCRMQNVHPRFEHDFCVSVGDCTKLALPPPNVPTFVSKLFETFIIDKCDRTEALSCAV